MRQQVRILALRISQEEDGVAGGDEPAWRPQEAIMGDDETGMDGDQTEDRRFPPNWPDFPAGHLKQTIEKAWPTRPPSGSGRYDVIIQVEGNNPISGYGVIFHPSG
jgi:hypothetical protein